jgi:hypothetical protein
VETGLGAEPARKRAAAPDHRYWSSTYTRRRARRKAFRFFPLSTSPSKSQGRMALGTSPSKSQGRMALGSTRLGV